MSPPIFISYNWNQGEWVWDRLVPVLRAGDAEILIDREQFEAARALNQQMDEVQDRAGLHVLVLSPEFSFRRFGGRSRAARRVKFPPANRS